MGWLAAGSSDDTDKKHLLLQLKKLDNTSPGGLIGYIQRARKLLAESKAGVNPFEGCTPSVPEGVNLSFGSAEFERYEQMGLAAARDTVFVLVAGGLGERLGYSGIKVALPVEQTTGTTYLQSYVEAIQALQAKSNALAGGAPRKAQLAIMTSGDTHALTKELLEANDYFGMAPDQVTLMMQEKVACLMDSEAHLALDVDDIDNDPTTIVQQKPHGHGDVHKLIANAGLADEWAKQGFKWISFFQDTNALAFRALPSAIGVSVDKNFDINSMTVPRKAKEAIGAITKLTKEDGSSMVINVEYNQLDPMLRATTYPKGDVNDGATGCSPFPGNINQLVLKLAPYAATLKRTGGIIAEFVNPKYTNETKTAFKSAARLECMMQDYPKEVPNAKVGFTSMEGWAAYSPVKNNIVDAGKKAKAGNPAHGAFSGELDMYAANVKMFNEVDGVTVGGPHHIKLATAGGVKVFVPARVVYDAAFASTLADLKAKLGKVKVCKGSTLILQGEGIEVKNLWLDGSLKIKACPGAKVVVDGPRVKNSTYKWSGVESVAEGEEVDEVTAIRGFKVVPFAGPVLEFNEPGNYVVTDLP